MDVLVLYNRPVLPPDDPDAASEAGVLESVEAVAACLARRGHQVRTLAAGDDVRELLRAVTDVERPDVVFNLFEGLGGVGRGEAEITGLLELLGHAVTASPAAALGLVRDKARTKWLLAGAGVPTAEFVLVPRPEALDRTALERLLAAGPAIVKPAHEDASLGIGAESIVTDFSALERQIAAVEARYGAVLVERFIVGRELNVAVLALPTPELLPLAEIEFTGPGQPGWQIVTYDAKWEAGSAADRATTPRCPAAVDPATAERIGQIALAAFRLTGCRQYARVDIRLDEQQRPYVLEVNGNPDISPTAGLARALAAAGMAYEDFIERLVLGARERGFARRPRSGPGM